MPPNAILEWYAKRFPGVRGHFHAARFIEAYYNVNIGHKLHWFTLSDSMFESSYKQSKYNSLLY